jgi:hypothetical protein
LPASLLKSISSHSRHDLSRRVLLCGGGAMLAPMLVIAAGEAIAQTVDVRQWRGETAMTRQPEQVFAATMAEWRSLWSRVGLTAPAPFEPGRTCAVGIFLGARAGAGYAVNILSASRRRDRIMVVFEERAPDEIMMAQRTPPPPPSARAVAGGPAFATGNSFAAPGVAALSAPPPPSRPIGPPTSPWAIVLINRADLPVTVEQRLFR